MTEHTPGPWAWFGNPQTGQIYLATTHSGREYVMGFERMGFRFAQPNFRKDGRLVPAKDLLKFAVGNPEVTGYDAAKEDDSVYRYDITGIDNPDAALIARAPELLEENERLKGELAELQNHVRYYRGNYESVSRRNRELESTSAAALAESYAEELELDVERLKARIAELEADNASMKEHLEELQKENDGLTDQVEELELTLSGGKG